MFKNLHLCNPNQIEGLNYNIHIFYFDDIIELEYLDGLMQSVASNITNKNFLPFMVLNQVLSN